jgi:[protein-PII] uridylyltransferase
MSDLSTLHMQGVERQSAAFFESGDGLKSVADRSETVDAIVAEAFRRSFGETLEAAGVSLLAVGGYGRSQLFPQSDVDLLFLVTDDAEAERRRDALSSVVAELWDAKLRVSQSVRTITECGRYAVDNSELHVSLLDARYLAGDQDLYLDLTGRVLPKFFLREQQTLTRALIEAAQDRHREFGQTIYHLEPNIKEAPGGFRDFQLACWLSQLNSMQPDRVPLSEEHLPGDSAPQALAAKEFLFTLRCYLHYLSGRDDNRIDFDLQDQISEKGAGRAFVDVEHASEWMRHYYRHVRGVHRLALRSIEDFGAARNSLLHRMRSGRSKLSNSDFSVVNGRVFFRYSQALEVQPELALDLFRFVARHGIPLAARTERVVEQYLPVVCRYFSGASNLWAPLSDILRHKHAYEALTAMRETGALYALLPELAAIDCLVIRDFYHRYTVDEHTVLTIRMLNRLSEAKDKATVRLAELNVEVRRPALVCLALLFHDVGKASVLEGHIPESLEKAAVAMERIGVDSESQKFVNFLIEYHLTMSEFVTKRDISDPETVEEFANVVGAVENLRALTLITYADTAAVNRGAMTAWRRQLLWQFYTATHNRLTGHVEDRRIHVDPEAPVLAKAPESEREGLQNFLEGFPERYLRTHSVDQVLAQYELSKQLVSKEASITIDKKDSRYEVMVLTWDRPFLFAAVCAVMASFGLNIERAEAFANDQGMVLDTFTVTVSERRGGTDLDDADLNQIVRTLRRVLTGKEEVQDLLSKRGIGSGHRGRLPITPEVTYDNKTSSRATIFHVAAQDRTGLLFDLSSAFSRNSCDIEVVLIETQGRRAIDAFYIVGPAGKLSDEESEILIDELRGACKYKAA